MAASSLTTTTDQTRDDAATMREFPELAPYMLAAIEGAQIRKLGAENDSSGRMPGDPLNALIPGDGNTTPETLAAVMRITGRVISREQYRNTAPACRAALRRWALR
jgi:hypothetical protein